MQLGLRLGAERWNVEIDWHKERVGELVQHKGTIVIIASLTMFTAR